MYVKVPGLSQIPNSPFYSLQFPNRDTNHPNAHHLTGTARNKLELIAIIYALKTLYKPKKIKPDFVINDASLEGGGVLDCFLTCNSADYPSASWQEHHQEHRRGSVVDVKANGTLGSITYEDDFKVAVRKAGISAGRPHGSGGGRHYHLRLNGKPE